MWADFLDDDARVYGVDVNRAALETCPVQDDLYLFLEDVSASKVENSALGNSLYRIIVDDGSHVVSDMIMTYKRLRDYLAPNALYIIEDVGCTYNPSYQRKMLSEYQSVPLEDIEYSLLLNNRRAFERFVVSEINKIIMGRSTRTDFVALSKEVITFHTKPNYKLRVHIPDVIRNSFARSEHISHQIITVKQFVGKFKEVRGTLKPGEMATFTFDSKTFISSISDEAVFGDWIANIANELDAGMKKKYTSDILILYFGKGWIFLKKDEEAFHCKPNKVKINLSYYPTDENIASVKLERRKNRGHTLTELADYYMTDKGGSKHCYTPLYEQNYNLIKMIENSRL